MYTKSIVRYEIKPNIFLSIPVRSNIKTGRGNFSQIRLKSSLVKHEEIRSIEAYLDRRKEGSAKDRRRTRTSAFTVQGCS